MHILFTAYEFVTEKRPCGGFGHYLANIATILSQHNHRVTILIVSDHDSNFEWKKNIQVITFKYKYINKGLHIEKYIDTILHTNISFYVNRSLAFKEKIQEINKYYKIDLVQVNGDHLECWHRNWKIPTVVRLSSFTPWCQHAYNPNSNMEDMSWLDSWNSRLFFYPLRNADAIYAPSKCTANFVKMKLSRKIKIIESPFILKENNSDTILPVELIGKKYFLFFGRLCVLKGINTIILSIHQILEKNEDFYFVFAGNPEQKGLIQRLLSASGEYKSRVIFYNEIKDRDLMQEIVKNAYACILPSRADNLPNACIEAMGMGKIVIGSHGASFEQLIRNKKSGLLIKRDSPVSLINAVEYLVNMTPEMKKDMETNAKKRIRKMEPELIYQQVMDFYQSVIKEKNRKEKVIMSNLMKSAVTALTGAVVGGIVGVGVTGKISGNEKSKVQQMSDKHLELFKMMTQWVKVKQEGKNLSSYFERNGYKTIAIYGMSYAGETLVDELRDTKTNVLYGIDQRADRLYAEVDIVTLDEILEEVDAIVVTAITFFDEIEEKLKARVDCPIISLEDVLYEI